MDKLLKWLIVAVVIIAVLCFFIIMGLDAVDGLIETSKEIRNK